MTRYAMIDDANDMITYTGTWTVLGPLDPSSPEYNNTVHATRDPTATITLHAKDCTVINAYGTLDAPTTKGVPVSHWQLDNTPAAPFNRTGQVTPNHFYPDGYTSHVKFWPSGKIAEADHNLTVTFEGLNPDGPFFYFDFFLVLTGDKEYVEDVWLNSDNQQWAIDSFNTIQTTGSMGSSTSNDISEPLPDKNATASLGFHGTEITVYGSVNATAQKDDMIGVFQVDGGRPTTVYIGNITTPTSTLAETTPTRFENQIIWKITGLDDIAQNQHTMTISASATPTPVWGMDYVLYGPSYALSPSSTAAPSPAPASSSNKVSGGAIAGAVVGTLAGVALIIFAIWFLHRRAKRKALEMEAREYRPEMTDAGTTVNGGIGSSATTFATSRKKKRSSMQKRPGRSDNDRRMVDAGGPVLDISTPLETPAQGRTEGSDSITMGPSTAQTAYNYNRPAAVREVDGGVRLASGDSDEEPEREVEVLPPQYARY